jgi:ATP-binding cassette, subfamily B, bacterial PglK
MYEYKLVLSCLNSKEKKIIFIIFFLMFIVSITEIVSIGLISPLIIFITNRDGLEIVFFDKVLRYFNIADQVSTISIILLFILIFSLSLLFKIIVLYFSYKFVIKREYTISKRLLKNYLQKNYSFYLNNNYVNFSKNILSEVNQLIHGGLLPLVIVVTNFLFLLMVIIFLLIYHQKISIIFILSITILLLIIYNISKKKIIDIGNIRVKNNSARFRIVNDCFNLIREIKLKKLENYFLQKFDNSALNFSNSESSVLSLAFLPKHFVELFFILIFGIILLYSSFLNKNFIEILPDLTLFIFVSFKLLPVFSQIYSNYVIIKYTSKTLNALKIKNYDKEKKFNNIYNSKPQILSLNYSLELDNIDFKYKKNNKNILNNINIKFKKGDIIGLYGDSGSGKTTLINLLSGLLKPTKGFIKFDNEKVVNFNSNNINKLIGYVPQNYYLINTSIRENICLGLINQEINEEKLEKAIHLSKLNDLIKDKGIDFIIGENGKKLSGGQRQRISLARSLYYEPQMLIMDEATNSLDEKKENQIFHEIFEIDYKPIILVTSHKKEIINKCKIIYKIDNGNIIQSK